MKKVKLLLVKIICFCVVICGNAEEKDHSSRRAMTFIRQSITHTNDTNIVLVKSYSNPYGFYRDVYEFLDSASYTYDNALAIIALCNDGDTTNARKLCNTLKYLQNSDVQFQDGRLRNSYAINAPFDTTLVLSSDNYEKSTTTGEMAWILISWLYFMQETDSDEFLVPAIRLGNWIYSNCYCDNNFPGYVGGYLYENGLLVKQNWKSVEHNIDVYVAFKNLYEVTQDSIWLFRANNAQDFVFKMRSKDGGFFWAGTTNEGNINYFIPSDVQALAPLAFPDSASLQLSTNWAYAHCRVEKKNTTGIHFRNGGNDGIWPEGSAQTALALGFQKSGEKERYLLSHIKRIQDKYMNGGIPASYPDKIFTGFYRDNKPLNYYPFAHVGATAWYYLALKGTNPFRIRKKIKN